MSEQMSQQERMKLQDEQIKQTLAQVKHKLLVMSGKGGVGKSSVAVNLAVALAQAGRQVGLLDVDLHGPTVPVLLGLTGQMPESDGERMKPIEYMENLKVVSMGNLLDQPDRAVIWRGPLKIGAIRQFIADVVWGPLDYLVIDSPPGTGDEPLTVAQTFLGVQAVIVTTPQEVSLADVRKSINFCKQVNMPVLGLVENMSGYVCPSCGHTENIFGEGGGVKTAKQMGITLLGKVPIDPAMVQAGDEGKPYLAENAASPAGQAFAEIVKKIEAVSQSDRPSFEKQPEPKAEPAAQSQAEGDMLIAVPTAEGKLCMHFGHCQVMTLVEVKDGKIAGSRDVTPPPHEPGALPKFLSEQGANMILAGGMGSRAQDLFEGYGVHVVVGAPSIAPTEAVGQYLAGTMIAGDNICDH